MPGPEAKFATTLRRSFERTYGKDKYIFQALAAGPGMTGVPDRYVAAEGRSCLLELKVEPRKLTPNQKRFIEKDNACGGSSMWASLDPSGETFTLHVFVYGDWHEFMIKKIWHGQRWDWDVRKLMSLVPRRTLG